MHLETDISVAHVAPVLAAWAKKISFRGGEEWLIKKKMFNHIRSLRLACASASLLCLVLASNNWYFLLQAFEEKCYVNDQCCGSGINYFWVGFTVSFGYGSQWQIPMVGSSLILIKLVLGIWYNYYNMVSFIMSNYFRQEHIITVLHNNIGFWSETIDGCLFWSKNKIPPLLYLYCLFCIYFTI